MTAFIFYALPLRWLTAMHVQHGLGVVSFAIVSWHGATYWPIKGLLHDGTFGDKSQARECTLYCIFLYQSSFRLPWLLIYTCFFIITCVYHFMSFRFVHVPSLWPMVPHTMPVAQDIRNKQIQAQIKLTLFFFNWSGWHRYPTTRVYFHDMLPYDAHIWARRLQMRILCLSWKRSSKLSYLSVLNARMLAIAQLHSAHGGQLSAEMGQVEHFDMFDPS